LKKKIPRPFWMTYDQYQNAQIVFAECANCHLPARKWQLDEYAEAEKILEILEGDT